MSLKDFLVGVLLLRIAEAALRWTATKIWLWFVGLTSETAKSWWSKAHQHHLKKLQEAEKFLRNAGP